MRMTKERAPASQLLDTRITLANQSQMMTSPSSVQFSLYTPDRTHWIDQQINLVDIVNNEIIDIMIRARIYMHL